MAKYFWGTPIHFGLTFLTKGSLAASTSALASAHLHLGSLFCGQCTHSRIGESVRDRESERETETESESESA